MGDLRMRDVDTLISYEDAGAAKLGVARGDGLVAMERLEFGYRSLRELLEDGDEAIETVLVRADAALTAGTHTLSCDAVTLRPPIADPEKILCLGLNYAEHAAEAELEVAAAPPVFAKFANSLIGASGEIVMPAVSDKIDYEGELAVVIGRRCKDVCPDEALNFIAGYSVFNDVSARDLQTATSQWTAGKALDTFAPMGPGIAPRISIADPQALELTTRVNGEIVQQANTALMIFSIKTTVAFLSSLMTLNTGDIIATGTPGGVGFSREPPSFLRAGDVVEVTIDQVGSLRNAVVERTAVAEPV